MMSLFKRLLGRKKISKTLVSSMDSHKEAIALNLLTSTRMQMHFAQAWVADLTDDQTSLIVAYIRGLTDIVAKHHFPREMGAPQLLFCAVIGNLLERDPMACAKHADSLVLSNDPAFLKVFRAGALDADLIIAGELPVNLALALRVD